MPNEPKKASPLTESLLAGVAQDNANPDEVDARFMEQAAKVSSEDALLPPDEDDEEEDDDD